MLTAFNLIQIYSISQKTLTKYGTEHICYTVLKSNMPKYNKKCNNTLLVEKKHIQHECLCVARWVVRLVVAKFLHVFLHRQQLHLKLVA